MSKHIEYLKVASIKSVDELQQKDIALKLNLIDIRRNQIIIDKQAINIFRYPFYYIRYHHSYPFRIHLEVYVYVCIPHK